LPSMGAGRRTVWMPGPNLVEVHLRREDTGDAFCLLVDYPPPGWFLPPHRHLNEAETIYVVEGEFEMEVDGRASSLAPGQSLHVPRGVVHSSRNVGTTPGQRVLIFSPAGLEGFFLEAGAPTPDEEVDASAAGAAAQRYGMEFVAD
jgi:quercetin dioxygenase-like cupin family protein